MNRYITLLKIGFVLIGIRRGSALWRRRIKREKSILTLYV